MATNTYGKQPDPTKEVDPYTQALTGSQAANVFAGLPSGVGKGTPGTPSYTPQSTVDKNNETDQSSPSNLIGTGLVKSLGDLPPIPDDSVKDTPEAASKSDVDAQQSAYDLQAVNHAISPKTIKGPKLPTEQQDVDAALAPDEAALAAMPDEYKAAYAQLAPYIGEGNTPGAQALASAENASQGPIEKSLANQSKYLKESAKTIPTQGIIQALLGQSKYAIEYNGAQPANRADWNDSMDAIYAYLSGTPATGSGLPGLSSAAGVVPANSTPSIAGDTAGGGNG